MKLSYFEDTDTLYIEFKSTNIAESRVMDENTVIDLDEKGNLAAITLEYASSRTDLKNLTLAGIAAL